MGKEEHFTPRKEIKFDFLPRGETMIKKTGGILEEMTFENTETRTEYMVLRVGEPTFGPGGHVFNIFEIGPGGNRTFIGFVFKKDMAETELIERVKKLISDHTVSAMAIAGNPVIQEVIKHQGVSRGYW